MCDPKLAAADLIDCAEEGDHLGVHRALAQGADVRVHNGVALLRAAAYGSAPIVRTLIAHGALEAGNGEAALGRALANGDRAVARELIRAGVKVQPSRMDGDAFELATSINFELAREEIDLE